MEWFYNLFSDISSVAHIVIVFAIVIAAGVMLGKIKVGGISLGVAFVLFSGILVGHIYKTCVPESAYACPVEVLDFMQNLYIAWGCKWDLRSLKASRKADSPLTCSP